MNSIVREPDAHALKEPVVNGIGCRQLFERGLSHRGLRARVMGFYIILRARRLNW